MFSQLVSQLQSHARCKETEPKPKQPERSVIAARNAAEVLSALRFLEKTGVERMMKETGLSKSTVMKYMNDLETSGKAKRLSQRPIEWMHLQDRGSDGLAATTKCRRK